MVHVEIHCDQAALFHYLVKTPFVFLMARVAKANVDLLDVSGGRILQSNLSFKVGIDCE